jgi:hypothetical protein
MNPGLVTILLLALAVACAPARPEPSGPRPLPPDTPPDEPRPPDEPVTREPLVVPLKLSAGLRDADYAALIDALETWEEATNGQVRFEPSIGETTCHETHAVHLASDGES